MGDRVAKRRARRRAHGCGLIGAVGSRQRGCVAGAEVKVTVTVEVLLLFLAVVALDVARAWLAAHGPEGKNSPSPHHAIYLYSTILLTARNGHGPGKFSRSSLHTRSHPGCRKPPRRSRPPTRRASTRRSASPSPSTCSGGSCAPSSSAPRSPARPLSSTCSSRAPSCSSSSISSASPAPRSLPTAPCSAPAKTSMRRA
jgi:hypothetical protein